MDRWWSGRRAANPADAEAGLMNQSMWKGILPVVLLSPVCSAAAHPAIGSVSVVATVRDAVP
jgi:hypothetical protein